MNKTIVCFAFLALAVSALATDRREYTIVGRTAIMKHPAKVITPNVWKKDAKLTTIASTLSDFPFGVYFSLYNYYITGGTNTVGVPEYWQAVPFTPAANINATEVDASVVWAEGTNGVVLSLYTDASGLPGKAIHIWHVKNLAGFATCCQLATGKFKAGVPLNQGTQYWLVVRPDPVNSNMFAGWDLNTTDMRSHPIASYCTTTGTQCGAGNNKWSLGNAILPGFAVLGK